MHANAAADVPARLEALAALAGMGRESVAAQAASAFDAVLHLRRDAGRRYLAEVAVVTRGPGGGFGVTSALTALGGGAAGTGPDVEIGPGWAQLAARVGLAAGPGAP